MKNQDCLPARESTPQDIATDGSMAWTEEDFEALASLGAEARHAYDTAPLERPNRKKGPKKLRRQK